MQIAFQKTRLMMLFFAAMVIFSLTLLRCTRGNEETMTKASDRHLKNSFSTFIYNTIPENPSAQISSEYSNAVNSFSVNLLNTIYSSESFRSKNVVMSPYCIDRNLAIITEAATGTTQQELLSALGSRVALDGANAALSKLLYADKSVILQIADAMWLDSTRYTLLPLFKDTANKKYGGEAAGLNFGNVQASVAAMNHWIADNTSNHITNAIKESFITSFTALIVTSAIYFEADWTSPFDASETASYPFIAPSGTVQVQMMTSSYQHKTRKTNEYENAKIYYGTDQNDFFYLDIYMPIDMSIEDFIGQKCLAALAATDSLSYGGLRMPKFFFENEIDLKPSLQSLGINSAFDQNKSEIAGMAFDKNTKENAHLYIENIRHTAGIKTDEEGTVAYAVTSTGMGTASSEPISPDVVVDRPFVYFIRAGATGLVLFAGVVNNPNLSTE